MSARTSLLHYPVKLNIAAAAISMLIAGACYADPFFFSTGSANNLMAAASRP